MRTSAGEVSADAVPDLGEVLDHAPVVADVVRNGVVESVHRGTVIALDPDGKVVAALGPVDAAMFPRSALKPIQALGMLRCGLELEAAQLAVACSSHNGEPLHIALVESILSSAGLLPSQLLNTPDLPLHPPSQRVFLSTGGVADSLHQNCSGKHAAMLATCVANGWELASYRDPNHPLQRAIRETVDEVAGEAVSAVAVDGCGAPLFAISMAGLARAFAALTAGRQGSPEFQVAAAMRSHPVEVGGADRLVTRLMQAVPGLVAKDGAEGVFAAATGDGASVALKISDGSQRATGPVVAKALALLGVGEKLAEITEVVVLGAGAVVGGVRARALR